MGTCQAGVHELRFEKEQLHDKDDDIMTTSAAQILKDALELAPVDRAEMIERLFQSFDASGDRRVDAAWSEEIESRIDAYDQGRIAASRAEDVLARINQR
jgi:putative addiction module component (TIGR02574 family)